MTLHCFGDSWTAGYGTDLVPGSGPRVDHTNIDRDLCKRFSYGSRIRSMLDNKIDININGIGGGSNYDIYVSILDSIRKGYVKSNDCVIVMFTSVIREPLTILSLGRNHIHGAGYSIKHVVSSRIHHSNFQAHDWDDYPHAFQSLEESVFKECTMEIYKDFLVHRFNNNFVYEIVMNYICNLQILFDKLGVSYIFVNAFENVVNKKIKYLYNRINKKNWVLFGSTMSDYLCEIEPTLDQTLPYTCWEGDQKKVERNLDGPHPNRIGQQLIAELLYKELITRWPRVIQ